MDPVLKETERKLRILKTCVDKSVDGAEKALRSELESLRRLFAELVVPILSKLKQVGRIQLNSSFTMVGVSYELNVKTATVFVKWLRGEADSSYASLTIDYDKEEYKRKERLLSSLPCWGIHETWARLKVDDWRYCQLIEKMRPSFDARAMLSLVATLAVNANVIATALDVELASRMMMVRNILDMLRCQQKITNRVEALAQF